VSWIGLPIEAIDLKMMARCIELSKTAGKEGEFPFACVIAKDGEVRGRDHQSRQARWRSDPSCRDRRGRHGRKRALGHQGFIGLHALYECRALRDVLVPDPRDPHQPRRLFDRFAP